MTVSTGELQVPRLHEPHLGFLSLCAPGEYVLGVWVMDESLGPCIVAGIEEMGDCFMVNKIRRHCV